jgi:glycosyltransferase involved in cell wall biosynthesis
MASLGSRLLRRITREVSPVGRTLVRLRETMTPFRWLTRPAPVGINLAGYMRAEMGLGQVGRGVAAALDAAHIPFTVLNFEYLNESRHRDLSWAHKEGRRADHDVTLLVINPDNIFNARRQLPEKIFANRYVIAYWFWELAEIPPDWMPAFSLVDEVWAASRFVHRGLSAKSPVPVMHVPPVVRFEATPGLSRRHFGLPEDRFLFLTVCDASSFLERKNPAAVVSAFQKSFRRGDLSVGLVIKMSGPSHLRQDRTALRDHIRDWDNIIVLDETMTRDEIGSLLSATDCVVSLHRAEGFGLVPAEAMSLGKPVILTRWSGNVDYMTSDNSIGIDYQLVRLARDYGPYRAGQFWAEPDVEQAAGWMRRMATEPDLARVVGQCGQQTIHARYSASVVGHVIQQRLQQIRNRQR